MWRLISAEPLPDTNIVAKAEYIAMVCSTRLPGVYVVESPTFPRPPPPDIRPSPPASSTQIRRFHLLWPRKRLCQVVEILENPSATNHTWTVLAERGFTIGEEVYLPSKRSVLGVAGYGSRHRR